ncbi:MAG: serine/threonine-protein kinase [Thermoanaerobaculia bacterium]|jgi:serine/threonine protein kinase
MAERPPSEAGRVIAHYVVERVLGRGSAGIVYLARDTRINRLVALKSIDVASQRFEDARDADEFFQRLQREVELCGALNHRNIVTLYDAGYEEGRVSWLALEFVDGQTLLEIIRSTRPAALPLDRALAIASDLLQGLACAHAGGIVHRDVKPANVLVSRDGVAKIADFGIARPTESLMTVTGTLMGTPNYMSPEQVKGLTASPRSDLFSFGVVLYEMLTGRKAFGASDVSGVLYNIVHREHPQLDLPGLFPELVQLVDRLLAKSPDERPESANEALETIARLRDRLAAIASAPVPRETEVTERTDPTPAGTAVTDRGIWRNVPRAIAATIIATASIAFVATAVAIALRIDSSPSVTIPDAQLQEFAEKRQRLEGAEALCAEGRLDDCIAAYDAYLARYPWSVAAKEARDEASRLKNEEKRGAAKEATKGGWQRFKDRVKRVFH